VLAKHSKEVNGVMIKEFDALIQQQTWDLVLGPHNNNLIWCKWKSIYDHNKAPHTWYQILCKFLFGYEFVNSKSDSSLFILRSKGFGVIHSSVRR
jgi:hypothetical protein